MPAHNIYLQYNSPIQAPEKNKKDKIEAHLLKKYFILRPLLPHLICKPQYQGKMVLSLQR